MKAHKVTTITVRLDQDVDVLLRSASDATGADITELVTRALRTQLPKVVKVLWKQRERAVKSFFREKAHKHARN